MVLYAFRTCVYGVWLFLCSMGKVLFYTNVQSCVNVNGYLSPFFSLSRGVLQGCPLSPLLYVLVSGAFAVNIRANPRITGLSLPGAPAPLSPTSQYADDKSNPPYQRPSPDPEREQPQES